MALSLQLAALTSGCSFGAFGQQATATTVEQVVGDPVAGQAAMNAMVLPQRTFKEPLIFGDHVSGLDAGASKPAFADDSGLEVTLSPDESGAKVVCASVNYPDGGSATGWCLDASELRSGLAFGISQSFNGPVDIVGIVPDDVEHVRIGDQEVDVINNVWHYRAAPGVRVDLVVSSADGEKVAKLAW